MLRSVRCLLLLLAVVTVTAAAAAAPDAEPRPAPAPVEKPPPGLTVRTGEPGSRAILVATDALRPVVGAWHGILSPREMLAARPGPAAGEDGLVTLARPEDGVPRCLLVIGKKGAPRLIGPRVFLPGETIEASGRPAGTLAGRVLTVGGEGVGGATVLALEEPPGNFLAREPPALLGFEVETAKDGAFLLDGLPPGPFLLVVRAGERGGVILENVWCGEKPLELRLPAPAVLGGSVQAEPDGKPVKGAVVRFTPGPSEPFLDVVEATTDETGRWRTVGLLPGAYVMDVRAEGRLSLFSREVAPRAGDERLDLDVNMRLRGGIRGRVVDVATDPVAGARIYLAYPADTPSGDEAPDPERPVAVTDERGAFEVTELPPEGRLRVGVRAPGLAPVVVVDVAVAGGAVRVLEPVILPRGARVEGRVVAAEKTETGLPGARVVVVPLDEDPRSALETSPSWRCGETESAEDGAFSVEGLAPGLYRLAAARPDRVIAVSESFEVKRLEKGEKEVVRVLALFEGERIEGTVRDGQGKPVAGAFVVATPHTGGPWGRETRSAADGTFAIVGLRPGLHDVSAEAPGLAPAHAEGVGSGPLTLVLRAPGTVHGRVLTDDEATPAFSLAALRRVDTEDNRPDAERHVPVFFGRFRSPDGAFRVVDLPPGSYRIEVELAGGRSGYVDGVVVEAGATVEGIQIATAASGTLVGRVLGDGRAVEGALVSLLTPGASAARTMTHTDSEGGYRLERVPAGPVEIVVEARDFAPVRATGIRMLEGILQRLDDVVLGSGSALRILARGPTGQPLQGAAFTLESLGGFEHGGTLTRRTDEDGVLLFDLLQPGSYRVWRAGQTGETSWIVRVDEGIVADLLVDLGAGTYLDGTVRRDGAGVPRASIEAVRLDASDDARLDRRIHRTSTNADGHYALAALPAGAYVLRIRTSTRSDGFVIVPMNVPETRSHRFDVDLPRGGIVVSVVDQEGGEPLAGVDVRVRRATGRAGADLMAGLGREVGRGLTGPDGRLAVTGLAPGPYRVEAYRQGHGQVVAATEVPAEDGAVDVRLRMDRAGLVTGEVLDLRQRPVAGAYLVVRDAGGRPVTIRERIPVGSDGRFRIEGLATGTYRIRAEAPGHARDTRWRVDVFRGGEARLTFRLEEEGRLRVTVFGPGGLPLRGAEVEVLDAFGHHVWPPREDADLYRVFGSEWLTDVRGHVLVSSLPAGVHVVRARFVGLKPFSTRVQISTGVENRAAVVLLPD